MWRLKEKRTLDGANTITSMKHKHKGDRYDWRHHGCYNIAGLAKPAL